MADLSQLSIIVVSWNVRELLRACLAALPREAEIIVVDNASSDGTTQMVASEYPCVRLLANADNRGFTGGNNDGLRLASRAFVLFLNPDTVVQDGALDRMLGYLSAHPEVGVVGPRLKYGDGTLQSSRRRFPTLATALFESTPLAWHWPPERNPWARRYHMADIPADRTQEVDWLVGAALLTRREVLAQAGAFDEGYFMYSEELDWQRRVRQAGWKVVYLPEAVIVHYEGKSSGQATASRHIRFNRSKVRYFRKHHGRLQAGVLRFALLAMFASEWAIEAGKYLLGSQRPVRRARLAAYSQLIQSGLSK
ncbi:MAG: glycosyltransferase family 2 protein [Nitrososphaerales archaeon]